MITSEIAAAIKPYSIAVAPGFIRNKIGDEFFRETVVAGQR